ncbi:hypothetical protein BaRGS_00023624 [Batillaria attramentaria]|uniref:Uncharacterized protein n=1 Tax=Batillaria attramentaria TaxID=370345 RepID=A0ABD0KDA8_9CAEN
MGTRHLSQHSARHPSSGDQQQEDSVVPTPQGTSRAGTVTSRRKWTRLCQCRVLSGALLSSPPKGTQFAANRQSRADNSLSVSIPYIP